MQYSKSTYAFHEDGAVNQCLHSYKTYCPLISCTYLATISHLNWMLAVLMMLWSTKKSRIYILFTSRFPSANQRILLPTAELVHRINGEWRSG